MPEMWQFPTTGWNATKNWFTDAGEGFWSGFSDPDAAEAHQTSLTTGDGLFRTTEQFERKDHWETVGIFTIRMLENVVLPIGLAIAWANTAIVYAAAEVIKFIIPGFFENLIVDFAADVIAAGFQAPVSVAAAAINWIQDL